MLCALIMAGGKGTRFWPLSTEEKPKQFLSLITEDTMLQMTIKRLEGLVPVERIFISTGERYINYVREQLPDLPLRNIIIEPEARNTAPCIALSAMVINRYYKEATIAILPSDHLVENEEEFKNKLLAAYEYTKKDKEAIVTLGMKPNRPETGYGYINLNKKIDTIRNSDIYQVNKFIEKPNYEKALEYLDAGTYLWNGGMFIWNNDSILNSIRELLPNTYDALKEVMQINEDFLQDIINENYKKVDNISIDFGVMEKVQNIYVIPSEFGWDDVGNWTSIERYSELDEKGNVFKTEGIAFESKNNIVVTNKPILLNNVKNLIVVETDEYIMISSKSKEQDIKEAKKYLDNISILER
ncbi:mannose-1-phosphate guanylyltransferase [Clostridium intestinale]|uniref:mannose-1-phosphate guanylyltransferase n=1 Tax=Clostridium intestinale TaxID=36845 RepID=UPI002DD6975A|nr:mannose-1-phosphate guanylyltransferase [Clostridium intestinale]WRY49826.1 mannose-1-phosphate guanylyltransferase [Clostridium intestinale]